MIICITETHLKPKYSPKFKNYNIYRKDRDDGYGGLLVLCHKSITAKANNLSTPQGHEMESLSIKYNFQNKWSTIILLYNPCKSICENEFEYYFDQIDETGIICGDLNAHHQSWETQGPKPNSSGKSLFSVLTRSANLRLQNPADHPTRIDPQTGNTSNIDLIIFSHHYNSFHLGIGEDLGSDHQPVIIYPQERNIPILYIRSRWTLNEDLWSVWRSSLEEVSDRSLTSESFQSEYIRFKESILKTSERIFTLSDSSLPRRPGQPWWNRECDQAVSARRRALKNFARRPTPHNKTLLNQASSIAKAVTKKAKEESWSCFLSNLNARTPITSVWKFFRAMNGKNFSSNVPISCSNDNPADPRETAEIMATHYQKNFSHQVNLDPVDANKLGAALTVSSTGGLNSPITYQELERSLNKTPSSSSPGPDLIHNQFLKNLPSNYKTWMLSLFNSSLNSGNYRLTGKSLPLSLS